ncbi:MAG: hypothetical protein E7Z87_02900 [Cyanobacteria bacterium SIG26]|nr:hypothetical protein [Cyanobacteria bacterium SIG26]
MLTVQPNFTTKYVQKPLAFKGEGTLELTEENYNQKKDYYQKQIQDLNDVIQDEKAPSALKKFAKVAKVISEGVLEGWAVAWGAKKGGDVIKGSTLKALNSNFVKGAKTYAKPLITHTKKYGAQVFEYIGKLFTKIKDTKFGQKVIENFDKFANTKTGAKIVEGLKIVANGFKAVGKFIAKHFNKVADKFKGKSVETNYDRIAKTTATTLGVGAGATSAYNAMRPEDKENPKNDTVQDDDEICAEEDEV